MRRHVEVDNAVAAELAGSGDTVLRTLQDHLDCQIFLRERARSVARFFEETLFRNSLACY